GFGNLTDQNVTAGSAPSYHVTPSASNNHLGGEDANGNASGYSYDVENPMVSPTGITRSWQYAYAPGNRRVWRATYTKLGQTVTTDEITFWSVSGQKLATYQIVENVYQGGNPITPTMTATQTGTNYYFGGKMIKNAGGYVGADRLGSIGKYYP